MKQVAGDEFCVNGEAEPLIMPNLSPGELANAMPMGVAIVDAAGRIVFANSELSRMTGHAIDRLIGLPVDQLLPARARERHAADRAGFVRAPTERAMGAGRELFAARADGSEYPVEVGLRPVQFDGERMTLATVIDVTTRRQMESAFRSIFESAPCGMMLTDRAGCIIHVNERLLRMFDYSAQELIGQPIEILLPHRVRSGHVALRDSYAADPTPRLMGSGRDLTGRRRDGVELPVAIGLSSVTTQQGVMTCAWVLDITERRRNELRLKEANAQLEEFSHVASHDLRSPLRGIANLIEFMQEDYGTSAPEPVRRNLKRMQERVHNMERLIDDLLAYARAGRRAVKSETIDLRAIMEEVIALESPGPEVTIKLELGEETFEGALTPLTTVLRNLLSNAIKHHDRVDKAITVRGRIEGDQCVIDVIDDGPGIPEAVQARAFRLFQTVSAGERKGSGLGLAVVQRLVESHGGTVQLISSDRQRGCCFRIWWPCIARTDLDD